MLVSLDSRTEELEVSTGGLISATVMSSMPRYLTKQKFAVDFAALFSLLLYTVAYNLFNLLVSSTAVKAVLFFIPSLVCMQPVSPRVAERPENIRDMLVLLSRVLIYSFL